MTRAIEEAEAHLRACKACRHFLAGHAAFADELRPAAMQPDAPAAIRERIFDSLARERVQQAARRNRVVRATGLLLVAAAALGIGVWVTRPLPDDDGWRRQLVAVAEDHVRSAHDESIASTDAPTVQRWLSGRVAFAVQIPMLPDAAFEGARLCYMDGRRGAVLRYRVDGREVSYYVMPAGPSSLSLPAPEEFLRGAEGGYQVVAWQDAGLIHALVGDLPEARLLELAQSCVGRPVAGRFEERESVARESSVSIGRPVMSVGPVPIQMNRARRSRREGVQRGGEEHTVDARGQRARGRDGGRTVDDEGRSGGAVPRRGRTG